MLGLGSSIVKPGKIGKPIVTDNLLLRHKYIGGEVHQVSTGAAFFDGTDDYITMGDVCDIGSSVDFSIALWVYLPEATSQYLISKYVDANNFWYIRTQGADQIQFYSKMSGSAVIDRGSGVALSQNTWHHVALTADRSDGSAGFKIYYNGVLQASGAANATDLDNAGNLYFGRVDTSYMGGNMCNVGIWNAVLTQAQIKSIMWKDYSGLTSSETTNLVSWWNLDSTITSTSVLDNHYGGSSELGSELVTNGSFITDSGWSTNPNWTIDATGDATAVADGSSSYDINQVITSHPVVNNVYKITFDVVSVTAGSVHCKFGGAVGTSRDSVGTYTEYITASDTSRLYIDSHGVNLFVGSVDNVSVKLVNGNTGTLS